MLAYYGDRLSPNLTETPEGYLICRNVPIARTGNMEYLSQELQLDGGPERLVTVTRDVGEVFDKAALASFEGKPVTDGHPPEDVTPENFAGYARGHVQNVRPEEPYLLADLHITDPVLISQIKNRAKREVSCGYQCVYAPNGDGTFAQRRIRGNHVAIVPCGRAGKNVSIRDAVPSEHFKQERRKPIMRDKTLGFLSMFGRAVKDAAPEELDQLAQDAAAVLEAAPEQPPVEKPETKTTQDAMLTQLGEKLDRLLTAMDEANKAAETPEEPEKKLDEVIDALSGKEEEAVVISPKEGVASDAAVAILKSARPAVAAIKDLEERKRVTDALLSAVRGVQDHTMGDFMAASRSSAEKSAQDAAPLDLSAQQSVYDALNPHKKKEV